MAAPTASTIEDTPGLAAVDRAGTSPGWTRKYPPLVATLVAIFIAAMVLPSALNLPQSNPTETLEYAPVPPDDDNPPPVVGNVSSFGLGESGSLESDELGQGDGEGDGDAGFDEVELPGKTPSTKRCVGSPPRQTEDPNSPPCVAHFTGDNFGATYQGVTRNEIKVLIYAQGFTRNVATCRDPNQVTPDGSYFDLDQPPESGEHCVVRVMRNMFKFFNDRYQTYDRTVHGYVYFSGSGDTPEERRADAADNYSQIRPFAVISTAESQGEVYIDGMAKKKVLNFGSQLNRPQELFQKYPKLVWGYPPSLEVQADMYVDWVCTKLADKPTSFAGTTVGNGKPRRFGMWFTKDKAHPELVKLATAVKERLRSCGVTMSVADQRYPSAGYVQDNRHPPKYAQEAVANFQGAEVTTILWPSGLETQLSKSMDSRSYFPEISVLGDKIIETDNAAGFQGKVAWAQARIVTANITHRTDLKDEPCYAAYKEADPSADEADIQFQACPIYNDFRQLFTGIQVAGPRLGPTSIDKGFRAIPKRPSGDRLVPACFYEPGDYTCVKDMMEERWEPAANSGEGCYRSVLDGRRFLRGGWSRKNAGADDKPTDPCNAYTDGNYTNPNPPNPLGSE